MNLLRTPPRMCNTSSVNLKEGSPLDIAIGKLWLPSPQNNLSMVLEESLETSTPSFPGVQPPPPIVRKKRPVLKALNLNLEANPFREMLESNGSQFGPPPSPETYPGNFSLFFNVRIPANVRVVNYRTIRSIASDYSKAVGLERKCMVYWGKTGTGKSRRAWDEAGLDAYCKDPRTKFWDGYTFEKNVVLDEFRGGIDVAHLLRWLDRYPVRVEIKGSSRPFLAEKIWITSNISPVMWYPMLDEETLAALMRRLEVIEFV